MHRRRTDLALMKPAGDAAIGAGARAPYAHKWQRPSVQAWPGPVVRKSGAREEKIGGHDAAVLNAGNITA